jgi:hypothetical protein
MHKVRVRKTRDFASPSPSDTWRLSAEDLVSRAHDDDDALLRLIERDPRFLASELVIAKVLEWRLQVILSRYVRGSRKQAGKKPIVSETAIQKLESLADAIVSTGTSGSSAHISPNELIDTEQWVQQQVNKAARLIDRGFGKRVEPDLRAVALAKKVRLPGYVDQIAELIAKPKAQAAVVTRILAAWFNTESIEKHRQAAKRMGVSARDE